ncbi:Hypothetical protein CINCED_3A000850, partial [Cinara cedri]
MYFLTLSGRTAFSFAIRLVYAIALYAYRANTPDKHIEATIAAKITCVHVIGNIVYRARVT